MLAAIFSLAMLLPSTSSRCDPPPFVVTGPGTMVGWPQQPVPGGSGGSDLEPVPCGAKP